MEGDYRMLKDLYTCLDVDIRFHHHAVIPHLSTIALITVYLNTSCRQKATKLITSFLISDFMYKSFGGPSLFL